MRHRHPILLVFTILSLIAASLACNLPTGGSRVAAPTEIPVSTEAVVQIATQVVAAATQVASGGPITLEFTEQQLTSAAALELQNQNDYQVEKIQVRLRDGLMTITGGIVQSGFNLPLQIVMRVNPNSQGIPQADVVEASIGPLPIPDSLSSEIESSFNQMIQAELAASGKNIVVDSITIADGKMTISAHTR